MANLLSTVVNGYLASKLFIPGFDGSGWKIWEWVKGRYKLEVDDLTVRGTMTIFELVISKIRALLGAMAITQANGKIKGVREDVDYYYLEIEDEMSFVEHDIVRCQTFNKNNIHGYWVEISEILGNEVKVSKDEFARDGEGRMADPPREGDELVQFGNSSKEAKYAGRHSAIYLSADETGQPCIDVLQGIYAKSFDGCLKLRAGCLDGINDADFPGGVKDFGIYCANGYFKGDIAGAGGYMLRSDGSGYIAGGAISWRWNAVQKKYVVTMGSDVVLQWENLSEETRRNLKGKDGRDGINGRHGAKGDPGRDADIVFPWLEEWQANGTTIGGEFVVSPKMFSGTRDANTGKLTGVAFGKDCLTVGGETRTGIFAVVDDEVVFELDPVNKRYSFNGSVNIHGRFLRPFKGVAIHEDAIVDISDETNMYIRMTRNSFANIPPGRDGQSLQIALFADFSGDKDCGISCLATAADGRAYPTIFRIPELWALRATAAYAVFDLVYCKAFEDFNEEGAMFHNGWVCLNQLAY